MKYERKERGYEKEKTKQDLTSAKDPEGRASPYHRLDYLT